MLLADSRTFRCHHTVKEFKFTTLLQAGFRFQELEGFVDVIGWILAEEGQGLVPAGGVFQCYVMLILQRGMDHSGQQFHSN